MFKRLVLFSSVSALLLTGTMTFPKQSYAQTGGQVQDFCGSVYLANNQSNIRYNQVEEIPFQISSLPAPFGRPLSKVEFHLFNKEAQGTAATPPQMKDSAGQPLIVTRTFNNNFSSGTIGLRWNEVYVRDYATWARSGSAPFRVQVNVVLFDTQGNRTAYKASCVVQLTLGQPVCAANGRLTMAMAERIPNSNPAQYTNVTGSTLPQDGRARFSLQTPYNQSGMEVRLINRDTNREISVARSLLANNGIGPLGVKVPVNNSPTSQLDMVWDQVAQVDRNNSNLYPFNFKVEAYFYDSGNNRSTSPCTSEFKVTRQPFCASADFVAKNGAAISATRTLALKPNETVDIKIVSEATLAAYKVNFGWMGLYGVGGSAYRSANGIYSYLMHTAPYVRATTANSYTARYSYADLFKPNYARTGNPIQDPVQINAYLGQAVGDTTVRMSSPEVACTLTVRRDTTATPVVTPGRTPTVTPARTPTVTPARTPTVTPARTPTVTPGRTPTVTPSVSNSTLRTYCPNPTGDRKLVTEISPSSLIDTNRLSMYRLRLYSGNQLMEETTIRTITNGRIVFNAWNSMLANGPTYTYVLVRMQLAQQPEAQIVRLTSNNVQPCPPATSGPTATPNTNNPPINLTTSCLGENTTISVRPGYFEAQRVGEYFLEAFEGNTSRGRVAGRTVSPNADTITFNPWPTALVAKTTYRFVFTYPRNNVSYSVTVTIPECSKCDNPTELCLIVDRTGSMGSSTNRNSYLSRELDAFNDLTQRLSKIKSTNMKVGTIQLQGTNGDYRNTNPRSAFNPSRLLGVGTAAQASSMFFAPNATNRITAGEFFRGGVATCLECAINRARLDFFGKQYPANTQNLRKIMVMISDGDGNMVQTLKSGMPTNQVVDSTLNLDQATDRVTHRLVYNRTVASAELTKQQGVSSYVVGYGNRDKFSNGQFIYNTQGLLKKIASSEGSPYYRYANNPGSWDEAVLRMENHICQKASYKLQMTAVRADAGTDKGFVAQLFDAVGSFAAQN